jgi:hypothetical protein
MYFPASNSTCVELRAYAVDITALLDAAGDADDVSPRVPPEQASLKTLWLQPTSAFQTGRGLADNVNVAM